MTSTTFIRREIEALERLGVEVRRFSAREWDGPLVDPQDLAEKKITTYLLTNNTSNLILAFLRELFTNPRGIGRALPTWARMLMNSREGLVRHVAYLLQAVHFRRRSTENGIQHVHTHFATNATAIAMLSFIMGGPGYSFTVHGPDELMDLPSLSIDLKIHHARFVVAISTYCRSQLLPYAMAGDSEKIRINRCGIFLDDIVYTPATESQTFVCVGRLCRQKGQIHIPEAVAALREDFPHLNVVVIGDGETREELEDAIERYAVQDAVQLRGWATNAEVIREIRQSRAFLLPSYAEGLPVVIMESLATGRPVVSTTIAGIPELVDDGCGWLFPPGGVDEMVATMRTALVQTKEQLERMGACGRAKVQQFHDVRTSAQALAAWFDVAVRQDPRTPCVAEARHDRG